MNKTKPFCISKRSVMAAWERVKANKGSEGIDDESIEDFELDLKDNLYKIWNRMSSGSYLAPPVMAVEILKSDGHKRLLGIPTVSDRVTPLERWRRDLIKIRPLDATYNIDEIFYHRLQRKVRKDGTIQWCSKLFEVPFELVGKKVILVIDPHADKALWVESESGTKLGDVAPLDPIANNNRKRLRPLAPIADTKNTVNSVDLAYQDYCDSYQLDKG